MACCTTRCLRHVLEQHFPACFADAGWRAIYDSEFNHQRFEYGCDRIIGGVNGTSGIEGDGLAADVAGSFSANSVRSLMTLSPAGGILSVALVGLVTTGFFLKTVVCRMRSSDS